MLPTVQTAQQPTQPFRQGLPFAPVARPVAGAAEAGRPAPVQFQGGMTLLNKAVSGFTHYIFDQGEGVRYAFEQTVGYTFPRTFQQLNRTRKHTGEWNFLAGTEMLVRDLAADFADTFLPGLLATFAVGKVIDYRHNTFVRHNMGHEALKFYQDLLKDGAGNALSRPQFFGQLETLLKQAAGDHAKDITLNLESAITGAANDQALGKVAEQLIEDLKLPHLDLNLTSVTGGKNLEIALPDLLKDTWNLTRSKALTELEATSPKWGEALGTLVSKTKGLMKHQMWGNAVALAASISIPFGIRLMSKAISGKDAFPGTEALHRHYQGDSVAHHSDEEEDPGKFVLFPYLSKTVKEGNLLPSALAAGFFAVLGAAVYRRFKIAGLSPAKLKDWFKVYEFDRHFPFTTIKQMELTYGLLCGFRLLSSRNEAEYRETGLRDCLLGWPTLTYFFPWFRGVLGKVAEGSLKSRFNMSNMLMKPSGTIRSGSEISEQMYKNMGLGDKAGLAAQSAKLVQSWVTFLSAGVSWLMLAIAEPELGIQITNHFEMKKLAEAKAKSQPNPAFGNTSGNSSSVHFSESSPFAAFQAHQRGLVQNSYH
jgi:hypothetical protein